MQNFKPIVLWHNTDLRIFDHPALSAAGRSGQAVHPVAILDPQEQARLTDLEKAIYLDALNNLSRHYQKRGNGLCVLEGDPAELLPAMLAEVGAHELYFTQRFVDPRGQYRRGFAQHDWDIIEQVHQLGYTAQRFVGNSTRNFEHVLPNLSLDEYAVTKQLTIEPAVAYLVGAPIRPSVTWQSYPLDISDDPHEWSEEELYAVLKLGSYSIRQLWREYPDLHDTLLNWEYGLYQKYWQDM